MCLIPTPVAGEINRPLLQAVLTLRSFHGFLVARDGIEPPTPAFSEPLTDSSKSFELSGCH
ncbi:MAG: hypothetical protein DMF70_01545 [Acidobacteria bacterium]|nr:MAG: hypothetical protein DMF70_01545 [Acidobacteriota bacterium]